MNKDKKEEEYIPEYPATHCALLDNYREAMKSDLSKQSIAIGKVKELLRMFEMLKGDGVLPGYFERYFHCDVKNIIDSVGKPNQMTDEQRKLIYEISEFCRKFGGK